jgi:hypothetical protein
MLNAVSYVVVEKILIRRVDLRYDKDRNLHRKQLDAVE